MVHVGLMVRLEAKPGKEAALSAFLTGGLALALNEPETIVWFALRLSPTTFGIFDAFPGEPGRQAHLSGPIADALTQRAADLLAEQPKIERVDVLAAKVPG
jgi:quinol monooxygenase YgiN